LPLQCPLNVGDVGAGELGGSGQCRPDELAVTIDKVAADERPFRRRQSSMGQVAASDRPRPGAIDVYCRNAI
jgi:hypothetical protein